MTLNIAVFAAIPSPSDRTAKAVRARSLARTPAL